MLLELALAAGSILSRYPLGPNEICGSGRTCQAIIDEWNDATWSADVDDGIQVGTPGLASVRWYQDEFNRVLNANCGSGFVPNEAQHRFCGVTDELSNVLLSLAVGTNEGRYVQLHNFTELLRSPQINDLQCWKFKIDGKQIYNSWQQVCVENDSASDASVRILGAYSLACMKQRRGIWGHFGVDYCADYLQQGRAIWGLGTASHGEVKRLANGEYFLANGYNNQVGAPTTQDSIRPDYYELQFLMDFAKYQVNASLRTGVIQMLRHYSRSLGDNRIHRGKTGHFDASATTYTCDQLCLPTTPPYMDNTDTWRAVPALAGLLAVHPDTVPDDLRSLIFDAWWSRYAGGNPVYGPTAAKPFEIYADSIYGGVKPPTVYNYRTLGMWIPLFVHYDAVQARTAVSALIGKYDFSARHFSNDSTYYGAYYSQFAQRAVALAAGLLDPRGPRAAPADFDGDGRSDVVLYRDGVWWTYPPPP